jgi:hypothetical protein
MHSKPAKRAIRGGQDGYALMIVLFLLAVLTVGLLTIVVPAMTDNQREKEAELVWRGKQYVRGIRLYYQKMHRFPTDLEDLYKPKTGIRFMRQAYKDPMNTVDGSWRLIYVGPNGQLIGSLKNRTLGANQSAQGNAAGVGGSTFSNTSFGASSFGNSSFGNSNSSFGNSSFGNAQGNSQSNSSFGNSSFGNSSFGNSNNSTFSNNAQNNNAGGAANGQDRQNPNGDNANPDSFGAMGQPQSLQAADMPTTVIGGNIIGVGSKINKKSFLWFEKAKNYRQFEFVWDPSTDSITGQQAGTVPVNNAPLGPGMTAPGNSSFGNSSFGNNGQNSSFGNSNNGSSFGNSNNNNSGFGQNPTPPSNSGQGSSGTGTGNPPDTPLQSPQP